MPSTYDGGLPTIAFAQGTFSEFTHYSYNYYFHTITAVPGNAIRAGGVQGDSVDLSGFIAPYDESTQPPTWPQVTTGIGCIGHYTSSWQCLGPASSLGFYGHAAVYAFNKYFIIGGCWGTAIDDCVCSDKIWSIDLTDTTPPLGSTTPWVYYSMRKPRCYVSAALNDDGYVYVVHGTDEQGAPLSTFTRFSATDAFLLELDHSSDWNSAPTKWGSVTSGSLVSTTPTTASAAGSISTTATSTTTTSTTTTTSSTTTTTSSTKSTTSSTNTWHALIVERVLVSGGTHTSDGSISNVLYELNYRPYEYYLKQIGSAAMWSRYKHAMVSLSTVAAKYMETQCAIGGHDGQPVQCEDRHGNAVPVTQPPTQLLSRLSAAVAGENVVVVGGQHDAGHYGGNTMSSSDLTANWTSVASSTWNVAGAAMAATDDYVYVVGGYDLSTDDDSMAAGRVYQTDANAPGTVLSDNSLPPYATAGVYGHAAAAVNDTLYVVGGCVGLIRSTCTCSNGGAVSFNNGATWTNITLQTARCDVAAILHDDDAGALWIIGGVDSNENVLSSVEILHPDKTIAHQHPLAMEDGSAFDLRYFAATLRPEWSITSTTHTSTTRTTTTTTVPPYGRLYVSAANWAVTLDTDEAIVSEHVADGARQYHSLVYHESWLCAVGGENVAKDVFEPIRCALASNPDILSTDTKLEWNTSWWGSMEAIPQLTYPVSRASAVVFRGTLTVVGGFDGSAMIATTQYLDTSGAPEWKTATPGSFRPVQDGALVAASDGCLYHFGGLGSSGVSDTIHFLPDAAYPFGWQVVTSAASTNPQRLGIAAQGLSAAEIDRVIYIVGGQTSDGLCDDTVTLFDLATMTVATGTPLPTGRCLSVSAALNGALFVTGTHNITSGHPTITSHEVLQDGAWATVNWTHALKSIKAPQNVYIAGVVVLNTQAITSTTTTGTGNMLPMKRRPTWAPGPPPPKSHALDGPDGAIGIGAATLVAFGILGCYARCG